MREARLAYAAHRCEWRSLWKGRCGARDFLECHHRHYRTLGAESLSDVIMVCREHHRIADRRRRAWGAWPLIGRPFWRSSFPGPWSAKAAVPEGPSAGPIAPTVELPSGARPADGPPIDAPRSGP